MSMARVAWNRLRAIILIDAMLIGNCSENVLGDTMALTSRRFVNNFRLKRAEAGATIRQGSRGRHVHLLQMALIDLGYAMPRSVGGLYSPDGIYGAEMKEKVTAFQNANNLSPDGEVGQNTMRAFDHHCRAYTHRVKLHFRSISLADVPFHQSLKDAENTYAQYGIRIEFGSGISLGLSHEEEQKFNRVDGECNWVMDAGEFNDLHRLGGTVHSNDILVYYVKDFSDSIVGCGGHATNRPACTIAADGTRWTTAHEVGHVLLTKSYSPVHTGHTSNLMYNTTTVHGSRMPCLNNAQIAQIRRSACCVAF